MNSPRFKKNKKSNSMEPHHEMGNDPQQSGENLEIKPWNSSRLAKITAIMGRKTNNNIFSLSNRSSNLIAPNKQQPEVVSKTFSFKRYEGKPKTAPHNAAWRRNQHKNNLSQEMTRLGPVVTEQVLDDNFEDNLESINFYPQFRASLQQRKNLMYLKPYLKSTTRHKKQFNLSTFDGMERLKSELYKGINSSQNAYTQGQKEKIQSIQSQQNPQMSGAPNTNRSSIIEYMTEYAGEHKHEEQEKQLSSEKTRRPSGKGKVTSLSVLRQKLKNRYKDSNYADRITRVKRGEGVPITIIQ